ncbi:hypothetical protein K490DRAFT_59043 [Saccharata proteae CBS 121410]|uniref:Uncharacterized protein n=1 Tax=Saccharata proteae CBS 121410 TaxID=1314787 RepID=A0A9P4HSY2_9PEZI|nr:hypothetical protein K490DRAFT_59043 [Saccharata proteae CBS 121410]
MGQEGSRDEHDRRTGQPHGATTSRYQGEEWSARSAKEADSTVTESVVLNVRWRRRCVVARLWLMVAHGGLISQTKIIFAASCILELKTRCTEERIAGDPVVMGDSGRIDVDDMKVRLTKDLVGAKRREVQRGGPILAGQPRAERSRRIGSGIRCCARRLAMIKDLAGYYKRLSILICDAQTLGFEFATARDLGDSSGSGLRHSYPAALRTFAFRFHAQQRLPGDSLLKRSNGPVVTSFTTLRARRSRNRLQAREDDTAAIWRGLKTSSEKRSRERKESDEKFKKLSAKYKEQLNYMNEYTNFPEVEVRQSNDAGLGSKRRKIKILEDELQYVKADNSVLKEENEEIKKLQVLASSTYARMNTDVAGTFDSPRNTTLRRVRLSAECSIRPFARYY